MPHISVLDIVIVILFICVGVRSLDLRYIPKRHREHAFSSGFHHKESLTWVVKLKHSLLDDEDDISAADAVAADTGLLYQGQIRNLDGYFVFSHPSAVSTKHIHTSISSLTFQDGVTAVSEDKHMLIRDNVNQLLDQHPFVEWYMLQRVVPRFKRSSALMPNYRKLLTVPSSYSPMHFNDPLYYKQWHLVSIRFRKFDLLHYFGTGH